MRGYAGCLRTNNTIRQRLALGETQKATALAVAVIALFFILRVAHRILVDALMVKGGPLQVVSVMAPPKTGADLGPHFVFPSTRCFSIAACRT